MVQLRRRFWIEAALAVSCSVVFVATLVWRDWLELVFGIDPDGGSGAVEWLIVGVMAFATLSFSVLARTEWRRAHPATA
jgi:hypothetical protein